MNYYSKPKCHKTIIGYDSSNMPIYEWKCYCDTIGCQEPQKIEFDYSSNKNNIK